MRKLIIAALCAVLAACATSGTDNTQQVQVTYTQACAAYGAVFATALELRKADKLTPGQVEQISILSKQITPLCTGPLPANPDAAAQQITAAVTSLAIIEAVTKGGAQ